MNAINITERAREELQALEMPEGGFLRIRVVPGGCSGRTYAAGIDTQRSDNDVSLYESGALHVVTDTESADFLDGLEIDYSDDLVRSGFRFTNPKACGSCGCGSSFGG